MALEFPSSPTNGQVYNNYVFDSAKGVWGTSAPGPLVTRVTALETLKASTRVIPTSMSVGSGSGSFSTTTGLVTFTSATSVSLNGIFTANFPNYQLIVNLSASSGGSGLLLRFGVGTTDDTTSYSGSYAEHNGAGAWIFVGPTTFVRTGRIAAGGAGARATIFSPFSSVYRTYAEGASHDTDNLGAVGSGFYTTAKSHTRLTVLGELGAQMTGTLQVIGLS